MPQFFINSKDTMSVGTLDQLKRHRSRTFLAVFNPTGGAKTALTAERDKFHIPAVGARVHGTAIGRIATMDHFINVIYLVILRVESI